MGYSPGRPVRARLRNAVPGRPGESYYITVLYGKPITNEDSIRTLIAFLYNLANEKNLHGGQVGCQGVCPWFMTLFCQYTVKINKTTIQPDWLKTTSIEVADLVKCH